MLSNFCLLSGNDIPFYEAKVVIHQPTLKEIAFLGEEKFFLGCGLLNFSKDLLNSKDKSRLENINDFHILMTLIINGKKDSEKEVQENVAAGLAVLNLIFPGYNIAFERDEIQLEKDGFLGSINATNFDSFKTILCQMFGFGETKDTKDYNPSGSFAKKIAEKIKKRHQQLASLKGSKRQDIFGRYISILSIGCGISFNELFQYTVYQLYDSIKRFNLKREFDSYFKAKLAGAKDLADVQDWEIDLEDMSKEKK